MSAPTITLESSLSPEDFAYLVALASEGCDCSRGQQAGSVRGTEVVCDPCAARKWLNDGAELVGMK